MSAESQRIIIAENLERELVMAMAVMEHDKVFVLTDETTREKCWPVIKDYRCLKGAIVITIPAGDEAKNLESLTKVWTGLQEGGATRHSLLINLGGGMITDLGGFAASTFKRGMGFINIPTTLLSMTDASVGGKTGINFGGLKNEIGVFNDSKFVILDTRFLKTLDHANILSGYAEMLKHALISDQETWVQLITEDFGDGLEQRLSERLGSNVEVKERIVNVDPHEKAIRKALNFGHTVGHAIEALALRKNKPMLHGYAVAFGIVAELYLSSTKLNFPTVELRNTSKFIRENYGVPAITCDDYDELFELMTHDKKNTAGIVNFTLLAEIGGIRINQTATKEEIFEALDFLREG